MTITRSAADRTAAGPEPEPAAQHLPDWLMAMQATEESAGPTENPPSAPATVVVALPTPARAEPRPTPTAATVQAQLTPAALLAAEDLPAWLRKLGDASATPAPPPAPMPTPAAPAAVPQWVTPSASPTATPADQAAATETAPPVWGPRDVKPTPSVTGGAAIFASIAEAGVSGNPIELDLPASAPAQRAFTWWWVIAAIIVLGLVVALALFGLMPMLAGR